MQNDSETTTPARADGTSAAITRGPAVSPITLIGEADAIGVCDLDGNCS